MKAITIFSALLILFAVGCSEQNAPTEISSEELPKEIRLNKRAPIVNEDVPFGPITLINPCTGLPHEVFGTVDVRVQFFFLNDEGDHHFNLHLRFDFETSDGYSGSRVTRQVVNAKGFPVSTDEFSVSQGSSLNLSNEDGQRIIWNISFHMTVRNGELRSFVVNDKGAMCVGVPSDG